MTLPTFTADELKQRLTTPCKHRGVLLQANPECGCASIHECHIHGQCVPTNHVKIRACFTCADYSPKPFDMKTYFDRVVLVNLKRRPDRLASFREQTKDWPFAEPIIFEAIDGSKVPTPDGWVQGGGTWGCLQSHRQILERAIMDDVQSLLVLEDDLTCVDGYVEKLEAFLSAVPNDWDQLMLGGQHIAQPRRMPNGVVKCINCQRTHAYAIRGRFLRDLYARWTSHVSVTHCDHIMGPMQASYNVYAPDEFIFGQSHSKSDINGQVNPPKSWNPPKGDEKVYLVRGPREVVEHLREYGIHIGFTRNAQGYDVGLVAAINAPHLLTKWCNDLMWEVVSMEKGTVLGAWHPDLALDTLKAAWSGPVEELDASTLETALAALGRPPKRTRASNALVLFRGPRNALERATAFGWHSGYWKDSNTGQDRGLQNWARGGKSPVQLSTIIKALIEEARSIRNGVVAIWHPDVSVNDLAEATDLRIIEIAANTAEEADKLLEEALSEHRSR